MLQIFESLLRELIAADESTAIRWAVDSMLVTPNEVPAISTGLAVDSFVSLVKSRYLLKSRKIKVAHKELLPRKRASNGNPYRFGCRSYHVYESLMFLGSPILSDAIVTEVEKRLKENHLKSENLYQLIQRVQSECNSSNWLALSRKNGLIYFEVLHAL